jgi:hypothetical protein
VQIVMDPVHVGHNLNYQVADPQACAVCHPDQYSQWVGSPMSGRPWTAAGRRGEPLLRAPHGGGAVVELRVRSSRRLRKWLRRSRRWLAEHAVHRCHAIRLDAVRSARRRACPALAGPQQHELNETAPR